MRKIKKTISVLLSVLLIWQGLGCDFGLKVKAATPDNWIDAAADSFAGGVGSNDDPYQIATPEQLAYLAKQVNDGTDFSGKYFLQTVNLDLAGKEWTPIGYFSARSGHIFSGNGFRGTYDGGDHTISNLTITAVRTLSYQSDSPETVINPIGLFGMTRYSLIKNVHISGVDINIPTYANSLRVGSLIGETIASKIVNCSASSADNGISILSGRNEGLGGLIGETREDYSGGDTYLANCYTALSVSAPYGSGGGITGCHGSNCIMANCYTRGNITCSGVDQGGGLASVNYGNISNCYATGTVNGSQHPVAPNTTNAGFTIIGNSAFYLSNTSDSSVDGYTGIGETQSTMTSAAFVQTLNINRSCVSGLMPSGISLNKWKTVSSENDGYPEFDTSANDISGGVPSDPSAGFSGGDGTQENPYQISCRADMIQYEVNVNSNTVIASTGRYYNSAYYIVTKDIDMGGGMFTPIGLSSQTAFSGNFDFGNHIIIHYTSDTSTGVTTDYGGLIGVTSGAAVISNYEAAVIGTADTGVTLSDGSQTVSVKASGSTYPESSGYAFIENGQYLLREPYDWSGTITPTKTGYRCSPANRTYSNVKSNQIEQNYTCGLTTPTLNSSLAAMPDIAEDIPTDSNTGELVSGLLSGHASGPDGDTLGIAVTATDNTNGQWQYLMPGGQWWAIPKSGALSETNALLIPSGATIRFCPAVNYNGTATITYRAWDEALGGSSEGFANVSVNGAGTAFSAQESGAKINVIAVNDPPQVIKTGGKKALELGGATGEYMQVPDMHLDGSFTCEAYVYIKNANNYSRIFDFGGGTANSSTGEENGKEQNNEWFGFSATSGKMELQVYNSSSTDYIITDQALPTNQWVHVAAVFDKTASMGYIYWNGVLEQKGTIRQTENAVARINSYIGRSNWLQDSYLQGNISDISFWNTAKSQSQIQQDMGMKITGNETGLVAAYDMTSGSGTTVSDLSPNQKTAQLYSLNWVDNDLFDYNICGYENSDIAISNLRMIDVDAGSGTVQIKLSAPKGTLTFGSTTGLTFVSCSNGQSTLTVQGTMQDINSALSTLTYHPNTDFTGTDPITVQADDLGCTGDGGPQTSDVKTVNITVQPVTAPDAPTITSVTSGGSYDKAAVTFTPPLNNGGGGITGYTIAATPAGGGTAVTKNGDGSPITVSGLRPGITYNFTVSATNSAGTGAASSIVTYTTPGIPTAPAVHATVSGSPYDGSWTSGDVTMVVSGSTAIADTIDHYEYKIGDSEWAPLDARNTLTENANMNNTIYFRAVGSSGLSGTETTSRTVKIDKTAPTTPTVSFTNNPVKQIFNAISFGLFFNDTVDVSLSSTDNLSGVKNYEYQLVNDGGAPADDGWTVCGNTFSISSQFKGTIYARATDNASNVGAAAQSNKFVNDKATPTAPSISETVGGNAYNGTSWTAGNVKVVASASSALSGIDHYEYSTDNGGSWSAMPTESGVTDIVSGQAIADTWTITSDMNNTVLVRAVSNSGIKGPTASVNVKRDAVTPVLNVNVTGTVGQWTGSPVTFSLSNTASNVSPMTYYEKIGSGGWTLLTGNTINLTTDTNTTYQFKAVSASLIESGASTVYTVQIDKDTPSITSVDGNPVNWTNGSVTLTANANDTGGSGIAQYSFDGQNWQDFNTNTYPSNQTIPAGTIKVKDNAGNETSYDMDINITKIDKTSPVISSVTGNPTGWTNQDVTLTVNASDNSGIKEYSFDGGQHWQDSASSTYSSNTTIPSDKIQVKDNAGNITSYGTVTTIDKIDKTSPVINSVTGNPTDWTNQDVTLTVNATDAGGSNIAGYSFDGGQHWQDSASSTYSFNTTIPSDKIQVKDNAGNLSIYNMAITITKIDKTVPTTPIVSFANNPVKQILNAISFGLFFNDTVDVHLSSTDNLSGVKNYEYQLVSSGAPADDGWTACGSTFSISSQFKGTIYARATDNASNVGAAAQSNKFVNDKATPTAPSVSETVGGITYDGTGWTNGNIKLAASSSSALSGIDYYEYSTNNGSSWTKMEGQSLATDSTSDQYINDIQMISTDMDGTVLVRAVSNSGIKGQTTSVNVKRDAAVPSFTVGVIGTIGQWTDGPVTFAITATGGNFSPVVYYVKVGTADWTPISGNSITFSNSMNEVCQFKAISTAGGEATSGTYAVMIDANLPTVSVTGNPTDWTNQNVTLSVDAECAPYGVQNVTVSRDGESAVDITGQNIYTVTANGNYVFTATNRSGAPVSKTVDVTKIDKAAPTGMTVKVHQNSFTGFLHTITFGLFFNNTTDITLTADDALSGIHYYEYQLVDTSRGQSYNANGTWAESASGTFNIGPQFKGVVYARAIDQAGNVTASSEIVQTDGFAVDNHRPTAPAVVATVNGDAYNGGWTSGDVKLTASGSTALSGIDHYEYKIGDSGTWTKMPDLSGATDSTSGNSVVDTLSIASDMNSDVHIRAVSNSGIEGNDSVVTVKRDSVVPSIHVEVSGTTGQWTKDPVTFTLSNTENNISPIVYWVKIGSGDWTQISGNVYHVTGNVDTTYQFKAISGSGLASSASDTYTVKLASDTLEDVITKIDNLPDPGSASDNDITDHAQAIKDAKILYDTLSADEQSGVGQSRIDKLNRLIGRLNALLVIIPKDTDTGIIAGNIGTSVQVPELNDPDVSKVVVKLVVDPIASSGTQGNNIAVVSTSLNRSGTSLVAAYDVSLFKTVFDSAGNQTSTGKVSNFSITGPVTIRIPVPEQYQGRTDLQVVYIDDSGKVTPLTTTLVTVEGVQYLQFITTHFSIYAVTATEKTAPVPNPKTGEANDNLLLYIWPLGVSGFILTEGLMIRRRKRNLARQK